MNFLSTPGFRRPLLAAAIILAAAVAGCTKQEQKEAKAAVKDTYQDSKAAMGRAWDNVKDFAFDKREDFAASAKSLAAKMDVQISEVRANYSEAKASASRKAAMAELKDSEADYKAKLDALGTASADTWDAAKKNVILAWDRLEAAYHKARAD